MRATEVWRRLQFNLRTFFVLLTALAIWLGAVANRVREQREAANAIQAIGGAVIYQWQRRGDRRPVPGPLDIPVVPGEPDGPPWLRRIVGDDLFQAVTIVAFSATRPTTEVEILTSVPHLQRLRGLELVAIPTPISSAALRKLKRAVPRCKVVHRDIKRRHRRLVATRGVNRMVDGSKLPYRGHRHAVTRPLPTAIGS